jgi:hypothetical protein
MTRLKHKLSAYGTLFLHSSVKISLVAPVMLAAALVIAVLTVLQIESLVRAGADHLAQAPEKNLSASIVKTSITLQQYQDIAAVLTRLNPAVRISTTTQGSLRISVAHPELQPEWVYVLSTLQSHRSGILWEATMLCMKKCDDGGAAAAAELRGYTQAMRL